MRFEGHVTREGKFWLAEVPLLDGMSQGRSRKKALAMIVDWIESLVHRDDLGAKIHDLSRGRFEIEAENSAALIALMLRRRRQASGLTLSDVSRRLGARSRNAYARYEAGDAVPTIGKLDELMRAVGSDFVIRESAEDETRRR